MARSFFSAIQCRRQNGIALTSLEISRNAGYKGSKFL
jgi:hypothetical protein